MVTHESRSPTWPKNTDSACGLKKSAATMPEEPETPNGSVGSSTCLAGHGRHRRRELRLGSGSDHSRSFRFETPVRPGSRNPVPRRMLLVNRALAQRFRPPSLSFCWPSRWIACRRRRVLASVVWGAMAPTVLYPLEFRSQPGTQTPVHRCRRPVWHPGQPTSAPEP